MRSLSFREDLVRELADERTEGITLFLQACSHLGEIEGYMLVVVLLFALYSKKLAIQSSILVLLTMTLNHLLKILIQNPRPFVSEGSYLDYWAVPSEKAAELVTEFSTPSGHAMAAASLYVFLLLKVRNTAFRILCTAIIILTGLSRPYIGVHFIEDILIGWAIGIPIGYAGFRFADVLTRWWYKHQWWWQSITALGFGLLVWSLTLFVLERPVDEQPLPFISYLGFLYGLLVAYPIEHRHTNYEPSDHSFLAGVGRILSMGIVLVVVMTGLEMLFESIWSEYSVGGHVLRYIRYALVAATGVLITPYVFQWLERWSQRIE